MESTLLHVPSAISDADYEFLRQTVYEHSRINLGSDKRALVSARVGKRLRLLKIRSYEEYCRWLKSPAGADELANLLDVMSTNHTNFFREDAHFKFMVETFLPDWVQREGQTGGHLNVWSAASSSGEEPYTLAIVLAEFFGAKDCWSIAATDISTRVLARAEQAVYDEDKVAPVRPELLRRYFQRGVGKWAGHYRVKDELRERVHFQHLNLLQDSYPFSNQFQLIFCRNVMIYFDRPTQETLIRKLSQKLTSGGHLIVGHSESLGNITHTLRQLRPTIYHKP